MRTLLQFSALKASWMSAKHEIKTVKEYDFSVDCVRKAFIPMCFILAEIIGMNLSHTRRIDVCCAAIKEKLSEDLDTITQTLC